LLGSFLAELPAALARFGCNVETLPLAIVGARRRPFRRLLGWRRDGNRRRQLYAPGNVLRTHGVLGQQADRNIEVRFNRGFLRVCRRRRRDGERYANHACHVDLNHLPSLSRVLHV
jgi:hypothetical protein